MTPAELFLRRYRDFAAYNSWANRRLHDAAARLDDAAYRAERGAFFGSVHGTLNHLLTTDRIWMRRITGTGEAPTALDTILFEDCPALAQARREEDRRIAEVVGGLGEAELAGELHYRNSRGDPFVQPLSTVLDHLFNHQTHHRGQAHALISGFLGNDATPSLDLLMFHRETGLARPD
ncbi:DinB family protein [Starkeya koreensis]|uniref:DinB family protein n=1 Tax=Ancylobacter koreensis TaxID=266121 RepID=A0ABT0DNC0_9HYPH|nr:DinB family protein [Ancylobacter koreensis]MCK0208760.1 DinB family protein [Ancylobacter koreensis]